MSADALNKITLPDDAWVVEKSEDKALIEKQRAFEELESIKQARLETLEVIENTELERPSSRFLLLFFLFLLSFNFVIYRIEEQHREEAIKELEEVKKARHLAMEALDMSVQEELLKVIIHNQRQYLRLPL